MHNGDGPDLVDLRRKGFVDAEAAWNVIGEIRKCENARTLVM